MLPCQKDTNVIGSDVSAAGHAYRSRDYAEIVERGACGEAGFLICCHSNRIQLCQVPGDTHPIAEFFVFYF